MDPQLVSMFDGLHNAINGLQHTINDKIDTKFAVTDKKITEMYELHEATNDRISATDDRITELQKATEARINDLQRQVEAGRVVLKPDPSMRHTGFNAWCEQEFKQRYPNRHTDDMCTGLFTYSCVYSEPIYVDGWTIMQFDRAKGMLTDYILPQFNNKKVEQMTQSDYTRVLPLSDPEYRPAAVTDHSKQAKASLVTDVLLSFGAQWAERVPIGTNMPYNHNSVIHPMILNRYPNPTPSIMEIGDRVFFNGVITMSTYILAIPLNDPQELYAVMLDSLMQRVKLNVADCYYQVKLNYTSNNEKELPLILYKGADPSDFLYEQSILETLGEQLYEMYDYDRDLHHYHLDYTKFYIDTIRLTRSGSAPSKSYKSENLGWATVVDFKSVGNGCFVKVLREAILMMKKKGIMDIDANVSYKSFWKTLDRVLETDTFGRATDMTWAKQACANLGINLVVHDVQGNIIDREQVSASLTKVLRVVYKVGNGTGHFAYVSNYHPDRQIEADVPRPTSPVHVKNNTQTVHVYYDLETVHTVELLAESNVMPYSISWQIERGPTKHRCISKDENHSWLLQHMLDDVRDDFYKKKNKKNDVQYVFIAYNGARFDHHFLFMHLCANNWHMIRTPNQKKVIDLMFFLGQKSEAKAIGKVWDPYLFTMLPLKDACEAFKLEKGKGFMMHEEVQRAYEQGNLLEVLSKEGHIIGGYNDRDVEALEELVCKMVAEVHKAIGITLTQHPTIGSACYMLFKQDLKKHKCKPAKHWRTDKFIREGIIGGRVTRMQDAKRFSEGGAMVDLVSQYPYVMEGCLFPSGEENHYNDEQRAIKDYKDGKMGLWRCHVSMPVNENGHSVLPVRSEQRLGAKWDWDKHVDEKYVLDAQAITDVLRGGGNVYMQGEAVVWAEKAHIFRDYIKKFKKMKEDEDEKKRRGEPYNPVLRQMGKMFLNCLSGKVAQRNFLEETKYWAIGDQERLINYLEKHGLENTEIHPVCSAGMFTVRKRDEEEAYIKPYPSQLAVHIYSYAKSLMWNMLYSKMTVYYSDTDSGVISADDLAKCDNLYYPSKSTEKKEFGMLEVDEEGFTHLFSPMAKAYCLVSPKGEDDVTVHKHRFKGVRKQDEYQLPTGEWVSFDKQPFALYRMLYEKMEVKVRSFAFRSKILQGKYTHSWVEKLLNKQHAD